MISQFGETNFTPGHTPKIVLFGLLYCHCFAQYWNPSGTFKAVLIAVDMPKTLQTKCKTCFGVFGSIGFLKNAFPLLLEDQTLTNLKQI